MLALLAVVATTLPSGVYTGGKSARASFHFLPFLPGHSKTRSLPASGWLPSRTIDFSSISAMVACDDSADCSGGRRVELTWIDDRLREVTDPVGRVVKYEYDADGKMEAGFRKDKNLHPLNTDYDLYSKGPDGKSASALTAKISRDDIIRANDGAYVGLASEF